MNETLDRDLDMARNFLGLPLSGDIRRRLELLITEPTFERWDDCHGILLHPRLTLWQAILRVDPSFPTTGRATDRKGRVIREWPRLPSAELVLEAIRAATH